MFPYANDPHPCRDGCPICGYFEPYERVEPRPEPPLHAFGPYVHFEPLPEWWP